MEAAFWKKLKVVTDSHGHSVLSLCWTESSELRKRVALFIWWCISMAQAYAKAFYNSKEWERARLAYISYRRALDGGLCETCNDRLGKIVHHKIWLTQDNIHIPEIRIGFDNLKLDCQKCHNKEKDPATIPGRCRYSPEGEILPPFDDDGI